MFKSSRRCFGQHWGMSLMALTCQCGLQPSAMLHIVAFQFVTVEKTYFIQFVSDIIFLRNPIKMNHIMVSNLNRFVAIYDTTERHRQIWSSQSATENKIKTYFPNNQINVLRQPAFCSFLSQFSQRLYVTNRITHLFSRCSDFSKWHGHTRKHIFLASFIDLMLCWPDAYSFYFWFMERDVYVFSLTCSCV